MIASEIRADDIRADDLGQVGPLLDRFGVCIIASGLPEALLQGLDAVIDAAVANPPRPWRSQPSPTGMIDVFHQPAQWHVRQHPDMVSLLSHAVGTRDIWVSLDRVGLKQPVPDPGVAGSCFLHWDDEPQWASAARHDGNRALQGLLYLNDVGPNGGAFWCHPPFNDPEVRAAHLDRHPLVRTPYGDLIEAVGSPLHVTGYRGDMILWDYRIAHGSAPNTSDQARRCMYLTARPAGSVHERAALAAQVRNAHPPGWFIGPADGESPFAAWTDLGRQIAGLVPGPRA